VEWFEVAAVQSQTPRARIPSSSRQSTIVASKPQTRIRSRISYRSAEAGIEGDHKDPYSTAESITRLKNRSGLVHDNIIDRPREQVGFLFNSWLLNG